MKAPQLVALLLGVAWPLKRDAPLRQAWMDTQYGHLRIPSLPPCFSPPKCSPPPSQARRTSKPCDSMIPLALAHASCHYNTMRPLAYTKFTRQLHRTPSRHTRAVSPPSVRRSNSRLRVNVFVCALPSPYLASLLPHLHLARFCITAPLLPQFHTRHPCLSGINECLSSYSLYAQRLFGLKYEQGQESAHFTFMRRAVIIIILWERVAKATCFFGAGLSTKSGGRSLWN